MYRFLVFLHIFGAILFYLGHGATALAMFDLRKYREPAAIRARCVCASPRLAPSVLADC
jgi:hypothetical protein